MSTRTLFATDQDLWRLAQLIDCALRFQPLSHGHLVELKEELNAAKVLAKQEMPSDVVSLGSEVKVRELESGQETVYKIVFPREAHLGENRLSVLAPLGTALLGRRPGDVVELDGEIGKQLKVEEVRREPQSSATAA